MNISIKELKEKLIKVFEKNSEAKRSTMFKEMMQQIKREVLLEEDMDNVLG